MVKTIIGSSFSDRPGSGYSTRPPSPPATIAEQAHTISRFIDALGLKRPLIVGHSLGGAIALSLAVNHPEQVAGLALLAPVTHKPEKYAGDISRAGSFRSPFVRSLVAWTLAIPLSIMNRDIVLGAAFGPQPAPRDYATKAGGMSELAAGELHQRVPRSYRVPSTRGDPTARYGDIKVPVGVLYGTGDRILDPTAHQAALTAKLPDAECELIEGAGHMIPISSADRCVQFIARMAQRAGVGGASRPAKALA